MTQNIDTSFTFSCCCMVWHKEPATLQVAKWGEFKGSGLAKVNARRAELCGAYSLDLWRATTIYFCTQFIYLFMVCVFFKAQRSDMRWTFPTIRVPCMQKKAYWLPEYDLLVFKLDGILCGNFSKKSDKFAVIHLTGYLKFIHTPFQNRLLPEYSCVCDEKTRWY